MFMVMPAPAFRPMLMTRMVVMVMMAVLVLA